MYHLGCYEYLQLFYNPSSEGHVSFPKSIHFLNQIPDNSPPSTSNIMELNKLVENTLNDCSTI